MSVAGQGPLGEQPGASGAQPSAQWKWHSGTLYGDAGQTLAAVTAQRLNVISGSALTDGSELELLSSLDSPSASRFYLRATGPEGFTCEVRQAGLSVATLRARCADSKDPIMAVEERFYLLKRSTPLKRMRTIFAAVAEATEQRNGAVLSTNALFDTEPRFNGDLRVSFHRDIPLLDAIVLSYSCYLLDASPRIVRG